MSETAVSENGASENGASDDILTAIRLSKVFGGVVAVNDVSFSIPRRAIVSIIGPNGAGKTTFFNMLTGLYKPDTGGISFEGRNITSARPDQITHAGISRTFQNIRLWATMTALENVMVGNHTRMRTGLTGALLHPPRWVPTSIRLPLRRVNVEEDDVREKALEMLDLVGLSASHADQLAINLSYGDQRRVEIARALVSDPQLLLLDEPTAGMNPQESADLTRFMNRLRDERDLTILLIEHDMRVVMGVSERVTVFDNGEQIAEGAPTAVPGRPASRRGLPREAGLSRGDARSRRTSQTYYGNIQALKGVSLTVDEGEIVTLIGSNGAGKSTTLRSISGISPPRTGSIRFRRARDLEDRAPGHRGPRDLAVSRGPALLLAHDRAREPRHGRLPAPRQGEHPRRHRAGVRAVSAPLEREQSEGGHDVRRRAADARDRPSPDGAPEAAAPRRAVDGHRPGARRPHLRDDRGDHQAGHDDPARRAERQLRAGRLEPWVRARDRPGRDLRLVGEPAHQPAGPGGLPGGRLMVLALIGATALYLFLLWLASAWFGGYLSQRKGYGERAGLASGLLLTVLGPIIWLCIPARSGQRLEAQGRVRQVAEERDD